MLVRSPEQWELELPRILDLQEEGYTLQQIGKRLGVSRQRMYQVMNSFDLDTTRGLIIRNRRSTEARQCARNRKVIVALRHRGVPVDQIRSKMRTPIGNAFRTPKHTFCVHNGYVPWTVAGGTHFYQSAHHPGYFHIHLCCRRSHTKLDYAVYVGKDGVWIVSQALMDKYNPTRRHYRITIREDWLKAPFRTKHEEFLQGFERWDLLE